jgi:hypothetical protein
VNEGRKEGMRIEREMCAVRIIVWWKMKRREIRNTNKRKRKSKRKRKRKDRK